MQANQYLEDRARACRKLAQAERKPEMADALFQLAEVYERQVQAGGRPPRQMG